MAKYTIELYEYLKNNSLFDFQYSLTNPQHKLRLEDNIIQAYYFHELGSETPDRFKQRFMYKFILIIPIYNKYYEAWDLEQRILDNYDVTETFTRNTSSDTSSNSGGKTIFADTPQGNLNITAGFATNISQNDDLSNIGSDGTETWERKMQGNIGVQTDADAIKKYWETIINIDKMIIDELRDLFMEVY